MPDTNGRNGNATLADVAGALTRGGRGLAGLQLGLTPVGR